METAAEPGSSKSSSNSIPKQENSVRLGCKGCGAKYSSVQKSRLPMVIRCGHSFCASCSTKLKGKCFHCREVIKPVKNYGLIDILEELKDVNNDIRTKNEKIKELKKKIKEAGIEVSVESEDEESDEGSGEEDELEE